MQWIIGGLGIAIALWLARSDFKERLIPVWSLIAFACLGIIFQLFNPHASLIDLIPGTGIVCILWG
ncbi:MAG: hypothetical protein AAFV07_12525, partial [Bacteroidota bacterium]